MRKIWLFVSVLMLLSPVFAANPLINVSIAKYSPTPAEPGKYVDVWLKVENIGGSAKNVIVIVNSSYPFETIKGYDYIWNIGSLDTYQSAVKKFRLLVSRDSPLGINYLKVKYTSDSSSGKWVEAFLPLEVKSKTVLFGVTKMDPPILAPGSETQLKISIKNFGDVFLRNLKITLNGVNTEKSKIIPIGKNSEIVEKMNPGEEKTIIFNVSVDPETPSGLYNLIVNYQFETEDGDLISGSENIGIIVNTEPKLDVVITSDNLIVKGKINDVRFDVINEGPVDAEFVKLVLKPEEHILYLERNTKYIGEISSDDKEAVNMKIFVRKDSPDDIKLPVELVYRDPIGNEYRKVYFVDLKTFGEDELEKFGLKSNKWKIVIWILVIGLILYVLKKLNIFKKV